MVAMPATRGISHGARAQATVLNIQRMSTEDGPGLRTTVFFKGCTLACYWCHNPESIPSKAQLQWLDDRCIGCHTCIQVCPERSLSAGEQGVRIRRELCEACGTCAEACPSTAMEMLGTRWSLDALLREVEKDRAFFEQSGGGISASGGEPTAQAPFVQALFQACQERGLHTALDTCGMCGLEALERILPHCDLVLFDLKEIDNDKHQRFTGWGNERILENLLAAARHVRNSTRPSGLWVRTPLIPGATATEENVAGIGELIAGRLGDVVERWELCSFNNLCRDKYRRLGQIWRCEQEELLHRDLLDRLGEVARRSGVDPGRVHVTGAARLEA